MNDFVFVRPWLRVNPFTPGLSDMGSKTGLYELYGRLMESLDD